MRASNLRVGVALGIGLGVPLLVSAVVPHDVSPVGVARTPMLFAVVIATLLGGLAVGAIAAVASVLAAAYWFVPPYDTFATKSSDDLVSLLLFMAVSFSAIALVRVLVARTRREAELRGRTEAQLDAERDAVETLQYALLPSELPTVAGIDVTARYVG